MIDAADSEGGVRTKSIDEGEWWEEKDEVKE